MSDAPVPDDSPQPSADANGVVPERVDGELVDGPAGDAGGDDVDEVDETVDHPAKVMRIGTMLKQLLEEVRQSSLDEASRDRLREIYETSIEELGSTLSDDLRDELTRLALPFAGDTTPSAAELQIAKAQLVGWLEGLVQGMQAMLFAQQMAAQQQLQSMRGKLGPGGPAGPGAPGPAAPGQAPPDERPGVYL